MMKLLPLTSGCCRWQLLCILLFFSGLLHAQQKEPRLHLTFAPLALLDDISFPTISMGAECRLSKRVAVFTELGIKYRKSTYDAGPDSSFLASRGFKWKGEVRIYGLEGLVKKVMNWDDAFFKHTYAGFNVFYTRDAHNTQISYYALPDSVNERVDAFGVRKSVVGFNFLLGQNIPFPVKWFWIDIYAGMGGRWRFFSFTNKEFRAATDMFEDNSMDLTVQGIRHDADAYGREQGLLNITAGIRLCVAL